jgi:hypothetical protein
MSRNWTVSPRGALDVFVLGDFVGPPDDLFAVQRDITCHGISLVVARPADVQFADVPRIATSQVNGRHRILVITRGLPATEPRPAGTAGAGASSNAAENRWAVARLR